MIVHTSLNRALSVPDLLLMKQRKEKIACLTAYDASFSFLIDKVGIEVILVGDSLGMVIQGKTTTVPVTIENMIYHTQCVAKARQRAIVIADLPFLSYTTADLALSNCTKLIQSGAQMVKLEGAHIEIIQCLVNLGVPVCGHLGLLPQSIHQLGRYKVQGKNQKEADKITADALKIEQAGANLLVLECVPATLAATISDQLKIPVIGIGAGVSCDGQVLVLYDMLGISPNTCPRFAKNFMRTATDIPTAIGRFQQEVKQRLFPAKEHTY